jgi:hypothetical protein
MPPIIAPTNAPATPPTSTAGNEILLSECGSNEKLLAKTPIKTPVVAPTTAPINIPESLSEVFSMESFAGGFNDLRAVNFESDVSEFEVIVCAKRLQLTNENIRDKTMRIFIIIKV